MKIKDRKNIYLGRIDAQRAHELGTTDLNAAKMILENRNIVHRLSPEQLMDILLNIHTNGPIRANFRQVTLEQILKQDNCPRYMIIRKLMELKNKPENVNDPNKQSLYRLINEKIKHHDKGDWLLFKAPHAMDYAVMKDSASELGRDLNSLDTKFFAANARYRPDTFLPFAEGLNQLISTFHAERCHLDASERTSANRVCDKAGKIIQSELGRLEHMYPNSRQQEKGALKGLQTLLENHQTEINQAQQPAAAPAGQRP